MKKLTGKYEKEERELFEAKYPCIYLLGTLIEDEEFEDDDDYLMRCFAKEYPDLTFAHFEGYFGWVTGALDELEAEFNCCLDIEGSGAMLGLHACDEISLQDMNRLFEKMVKILEDGIVKDNIEEKC